MAIIGHVAYLCQVCVESQRILADVNTQDSESTQSQQLTLLKKIVQDIGKKRMDEICQKTFLDELTLMVETGEVNHKDFLQWLHSYIAEKYLEPFLAENVDIFLKIYKLSAVISLGMHAINRYMD